MQGRIVYHNGNQVELSGEVRHLHGCDWCVGTLIEGHAKGTEVVVLSDADRLKHRELAREDWEISQQGFRNLHALSQAARKLTVEDWSDPLLVLPAVGERLLTGHAPAYRPCFGTVLSVDVGARRVTVAS